MRWLVAGTWSCLAAGLAWSSGALHYAFTGQPMAAHLLAGYAMGITVAVGVFGAAAWLDKRANQPGAHGA